MRPISQRKSSWSGRHFAKQARIIDCILICWLLPSAKTASFPVKSLILQTTFISRNLQMKAHLRDQRPLQGLKTEWWKIADIFIAIKFRMLINTGLLQRHCFKESTNKPHGKHCPNIQWGQKMLFSHVDRTLLQVKPSPEKASCCSVSGHIYIVW